MATGNYSLPTLQPRFEVVLDLQFNFCFHLESLYSGIHYPRAIYSN